MDDANSRELARSPVLPYLAHQTRLGALPNGKPSRADAPSKLVPRPVFLHNGDGGGQHDTPQPRSGIPPLMVYPPPPPPPISVTEMNTPPPPPKPPSNGIYSSLIPEAPQSAVLNNLSYEQESLRDLREKLVGARFSLAAKRSELRNLHIETGAKDGHVFNLLRQYLNERRTDLPRDIDESLRDASALRDRLGLLEVEYDEAEIRYNALEWSYSRRETRFVEDLLGNKLVPSDTIDRSRSADNLGMLYLTSSMTRSADDETTAWNHTTFTDEPEPRYTKHLPIDLESQDVVSSGTATVEKQQSSSIRGDLGGLATMQSNNESYVHSAYPHLRWLEKARRIDAWLLEMVDSSALQQGFLRAIQDFGFTDKDTWWKHTKWLLIQDCRPSFHTGDSVASKQATNRDTSMPDILSSNPNSTIHEHSSEDSVLLGFHPSDVPDPPTVPSTIESSELHDALDEAEASRDNGKTLFPVAASSASKSQESTRSMSSRLPVIERVPVPNHDLVNGGHTDSPPLLGTSDLVGSASFRPGNERASPSSTPVISSRSIPGNIRPVLNPLQQGHNPPQTRVPEFMETTIPPIKSYSTSSLPRRSLPPVAGLSSLKRCGRRFSQASIPGRRRSMFRQSSSSFTTTLVSPPSKVKVSPAQNPAGHCLIM
jgi:hypothetical protein